MTDAMFIKNVKTALASTIDARITPKVSAAEKQIQALTQQMQEADTNLQVGIDTINAPNWVTSERIKDEAVDESKLSSEVQSKLNKEVVTTWEGLRNKPEAFPPSSHTHPVSQVVGYMEAIQGQVSPVASRLGSAEQSISTQQKAIQSLTEYRQTVEQHIADISPKVSANTQGIAGLKSTTQGLEASKATKQEVSTLSSRVDALSSSRVTSDDILSGVKQAIGSLRVEDPASLASLQSSIEKLNGNIQALESKLKSAKFVVESGGSSDKWYRLWSDGWLEQGGEAAITDGSHGVVTSFLKSFKDTSYTITETGLSGTHSYEYTDTWIEKRSASSFYWTKWGNYKMSYYACGYAAQ